LRHRDRWASILPRSRTVDGPKPKVHDHLPEFLEAMAAGKPIVAARAAAIPEVVRHGVLVEPENAEALADGIWRLWRDPILRAAISRQQAVDVEEYEMMSVTRRFLHEVSRTTG
jgi:glycosyltransferase involved in cell wall biosynthesis